MENEQSIIFKASNSSFEPAKKWSDRDWFDTSFSQSDRAIGHLRLPAVDNGRYESKHPILDSNRNLIGYLSGAGSSIGYTWNCIYAGNCFWLTNQTFSATMNNGGSNVTLVDEVGTFLFSSTRKFNAVKSFGFDGDWAGFTLAFKLLDDGTQLLYLTNKGFCFFNTHQRVIISQAEFSLFLSESSTDFTLSPKVKMLAIAGSSMGQKDPIDGEYRYKNFIWLYNLETGLLVGETSLEIDKYVRWSIDFSVDGRNLKVSSDSSSFQFELSAK
ncbi:hypothetical protein [Cyclobacterium plantarum]|uniref:hypothetical protein n=1 Tax=Cyclobacterium plantarum TaxID=2716263 RepID=UPI003F72AF7F